MRCPSALSRRALVGAGALGLGATVLGLSRALPVSAQSAGTIKPVGSLTLGWVKSTANLMSFLAPELGEKHGLKVESANFNTAVDISTAMINGSVDVGLLTPIHLIRAIDTRVDFVQIAGN